MTEFPLLRGCYNCIHFTECELREEMEHLMVKHKDKITILKVDCRKYEWGLLE